VIRADLAQSAEAVVQRRSRGMDLRGHDLPHVTPLSAGSVEHEPVRRNGVVSSQVADVHRAVRAILGQQSREHGQPCVLWRPVVHGAVVRQREPDRQLGLEQRAHDLAAQAELTGLDQLVVRQVERAVGRLEAERGLALW
jgi:hypothetical protein